MDKVIAMPNRKKRDLNQVEGLALESPRKIQKVSDTRGTSGFGYEISDPDYFDDEHGGSDKDSSLDDNNWEIIEACVMRGFIEGKLDLDDASSDILSYIEEDFGILIRKSKKRISQVGMLKCQIQENNIDLNRWALRDEYIDMAGISNAEFLTEIERRYCVEIEYVPLQVFIDCIKRELVEGVLSIHDDPGYIVKHIRDTYKVRCADHVRKYEKEKKSVVALKDTIKKSNLNMWKTGKCMQGYLKLTKQEFLSKLRELSDPEIEIVPWRVFDACIKKEFIAGNIKADDDGLHILQFIKEHYKINWEKEDRRKVNDCKKCLKGGRSEKTSMDTWREVKEKQGILHSCRQDFLNEMKVLASARSVCWEVFESCLKKEFFENNISTRADNMFIIEYIEKCYGVTCAKEDGRLVARLKGRLNTKDRRKGVNLKLWAKRQREEENLELSREEFLEKMERLANIVKKPVSWNEYKKLLEFLFEEDKLSPYDSNPHIKQYIVGNYELILEPDTYKHSLRDFKDTLIRDIERAK